MSHQWSMMLTRSHTRILTEQLLEQRTLRNAYLLKRIFLNISNGNILSHSNCYSYLRVYNFISSYYSVIKCEDIPGKQEHHQYYGCYGLDFIENISVVEAAVFGIFLWGTRASNTITKVICDIDQILYPPELTRGKTSQRMW